MRKRKAIKSKLLQEQQLCNGDCVSALFPNNNNNNFDDDNNNIIYSGKVDGRDTIFLDEALVLGQKTALTASLHCPPNCHTSIAAADHHHPLGEYDWALDEFICIRRNQ